MKRSGVTEEETLGIRKEVEVGAIGGAVCRPHTIGERTPYDWKSKCGGMQVSAAGRLAAALAAGRERAPRTEAALMRMGLLAGAAE